MELKRILHVSETSKEVVERLVKENLEHKVSAYLKKYEDKADAEWIVELTVEKNKKDLFNWKLIVNLDTDKFVFEREDYEHLDDLINNLFKHLKEELSSK